MRANRSCANNQDYAARGGECCQNALSCNAAFTDEHRASVVCLTGDKQKSNRVVVAHISLSYWVCMLWRLVHDHSGDDPLHPNDDRFNKGKAAKIGSLDLLVDDPCTPHQIGY